MASGGGLKALKPPHISWLHVIYLLACLLVTLMAAAVYIWRDDIFERLVDPAVPYLLYKPLPAPDYHRAADWALLPANPLTWSTKDDPADIFFVHPTTFDAGRWNDSIDDRRSASFLERVIIPNYAGPFGPVGRVFAPRYRQANLYSMLTLREDAREARAFPYGDVLAAFELYMHDYNKGRPVIIAGVEQGGALADRLVRDAIQPFPDRMKSFVAFYAIETGLAADQHAAGSPTPACQRRNQAGCVVAWISEEPGQQKLTRSRLRRASIWIGDQIEELAPRQPVCVNPLVGAATRAFVPRKANLGAANASRLEWGVQPGFLSDQVSAQCIDGVLHVSRPKSASLRSGHNWAERMRVSAYNLFYADLEADAKARVEALMAGKPPLAPPVEKIVYIQPSRTRR
jgi:hypothetical protein